MERKAYPTDVSDAEWALVAPYLTLMTEDAPQLALLQLDVTSQGAKIVHAAYQFTATVASLDLPKRKFSTDPRIADCTQMPSPEWRLRVTKKLRPATRKTLFV